MTRSLFCSFCFSLLSIGLLGISLLALSAATPVAAKELDAVTQNAIKVKLINAERAFEQKKYEEALFRVEEIEARAGNVAIAAVQALKARVLVELKRFDGARTALNTLYGLDPSNEDLTKIAPYADRVDQHFFTLKKQQQAQDAAWAKAEAENTEESYTEFAKAYPNTKMADIALGRRATLEKQRRKRMEDEAWAKAQNEDTEEAYADFAKTFGDTERASIARQKLEAIASVRQAKRIAVAIDTIPKHVATRLETTAEANAAQAALRATLSTERIRQYGSFNTPEDLEQFFEGAIKPALLTKKRKCRSQLKKYKEARKYCTKNGDPKAYQALWASINAPVSKAFEVADAATSRIGMDNYQIVEECNVLIGQDVVQPIVDACKSVNVSLN
ncbi:MAG: hypothetical protein AAF862_15715 [Pseudomonadota bacterium]